MEDLTRLSDITEARRIIKIQTEKLNEATAELSKYQIEFEVEVDMTTLDIRIKAMKPHGGGGLIKTISKDDALYFALDTQSLTEMVVADVQRVLLKDHMYNLLHDKLQRAIANVQMIEAKK